MPLAMAVGPQAYYHSLSETSDLLVTNDLRLPLGHLLGPPLVSQCIPPPYVRCANGNQEHLLYPGTDHKTIQNQLESPTGKFFTNKKVR